MALKKRQYHATRGSCNRFQAYYCFTHASYIPYLRRSLRQLLTVSAPRESGHVAKTMHLTRSESSHRKMCLFIKIRLSRSSSFVTRHLIISEPYITT